jgi:hypothetical protein
MTSWQYGKTFKLYAGFNNGLLLKELTCFIKIAPDVDKRI